MIKKAFIFDLDDTLYDQFLIFKQGFELFLETYTGKEELSSLPDSILRSIYIKSRYYGDQNFETIQKYPKKRFYYDSLRVRLAFGDFGFDLTAEDTNSIDSLYKKEQSNLVLADGMRECLAELKKEGHFIGVITNGYSKQQRDKLEALQLSEVINSDRILVSADTPWIKPQKELFEHYISEHNLENLATFYIGDSYENDVLGAWNSSITPIWLNKKKQLVEEGERDLYHVTSYDELYTSLKKISAQL